MKHESRIELMNFDESDFNRLISWIDNERALMQFAGPRFYFPLNQEQLSIFIYERQRKVFKIKLKSDSEIIGMAELFLNENQTAKFSRILIGEKKWRNKGLGKEIVNLLLEKAFNEYKCIGAELNVYDWNTAAVKCYQQCGFEINVNQIKELQFKEEIWVTLNMVLTREDWQRRNNH